MIQTSHQLPLPWWGKKASPCSKSDASTNTKEDAGNTKSRVKHFWDYTCEAYRLGTP